MPTVAETKEKVQSILTQMGRVELEKNGAFSMRHGSTRANVAVEDFGDGDTWIRISAPVIIKVDESPEVFEYIALNTHRRKYGTLFAERAEDGTLWLFMLHGILGTYLDPAELELALVLLARSADELDDELKGRFGGERYYEND